MISGDPVLLRVNTTDVNFTRSPAKLNRGGKTQEEKERCKGMRVKEIEGVVFVPHTPNSKLRNERQEQDELLAVALQAPSLRFVERSGTTVVQDVG